MTLTWKRPLKMPDMEPFWVPINGVIWCLGDCELPLASMGQRGRQTGKHYSFKTYTYIPSIHFTYASKKERTLYVHHNFQLNSVQVECLCGEEDGNVISFLWLLKRFNMVLGKNCWSHGFKQGQHDLILDS